MAANPSLVGSPIEDGSRSGSVVDSTIFYAVNTFFAMLKVSDALMRVSRTIRDRRRRAGENGSDERWWPALNHELNEKYIVPLMNELAAFHPKGGYDRDAAMAPLREASATLIDVKDEAPLPSIRTDGQLIEAHLEPAIALLCDRRAEDTSRDGLMREILRCKPRERFKNEAGRDLVSCLENLVASEPRSVPQMRTTDDISMLGMPGVVVEMSREEADAWGVVEEDAISFEDAWESQADIVSYMGVPLTNRALGWHECDTAAKSILLATSIEQQRIEARATPRKQGRNSPHACFCELCDELTEVKSRSCTRQLESTLDYQFCKPHAAMRRRPASGHGGEFHWLVSMMLHEARKDAEYKRRFMAPVSDCEMAAKLAAHIGMCLFCSGRATQSFCLEPSKHYFPALMAFHANVRKAARRLADSYHSNGVAFMIDEAAQRGERVRDTARYYGLHSEKAVGQHLGVALAHLLHQKVSGTEIASRLSISPSAVSQRRTALAGSFDFSPQRHWALRWWPFDDIGGSNVVKFPARALGTDWRHSPGEYEHLSSNRKTNIRSLTIGEAV